MGGKEDKFDRFDDKAELIGYDVALAREKAIEHAREFLSSTTAWLKGLSLVWEIESAKFEEDEDCYKVIVNCYPEDADVETKARWEYHIDAIGKLYPGTPILRVKGKWVTEQQPTTSDDQRIAEKKRWEEEQQRKEQEEIAAREQSEQQKRRVEEEQRRREEQRKRTEEEKRKAGEQKHTKEEQHRREEEEAKKRAKQSLGKKKTLPIVLGLIAIVAVIIVGVVVLTRGSDDGEDTYTPPISSPAITTSPTVAPVTVEPVKFTIGELTDITGISANAMVQTRMALEDIVEYYNANNLIPGVEFEIVTFDGQYNPAHDIPGYEWLKERGSDVMFTPVAATPITLSPLLKEDQMTMFTTFPYAEVIDPHGYVFGLGPTAAQETFTILRWLHDNDTDYPTARPARIGCAFWNTPDGVSIINAAEQYCSAHPDQYDWIDGYLTNYTFTWGPEIEALKNCDYVIIPDVMPSFVKEYRNAGYEAKFIGTNAHTSYIGMIDDTDLWDEIDNMLFIIPFQWWAESGTVIDLTEQLLYENHPDDAENVMLNGSGYLSTQQMYVMLELIAEAAEMAGPENLDSQAVYEAALSFSINVDGCSHSFNSTKRTSNDSLAIYKANASQKDLIRADSSWIPVVYEP